MLMGTMATVSKLEAGRLRDRYRRASEAIGEAAERSGRHASSVLSLAVTDEATPDQIRQLVQLGHQDLAEHNLAQLPQRALQLQEFLGRQRFLERFRPTADGEVNAVAVPASRPVRWHLVGPVQRGKLKPIIAHVKLIHSVCNLRVAEELHAFASRQDERRAEQARAGTPSDQPPEPIDVLLQVNTTSNPELPGVAPAAAVHLAGQIDTMMHLRLRGVAGTGEPAEDEQAIGLAFARCAGIFEDIRTAKIGGEGFAILAMGQDRRLATAIGHGANMVRLADALFGSGNI